MTFLYPAFLYLLPLSLLPIIWHIITIKSRKKVDIPSNFFIKKLLRHKRRHYWLTSYLELLLEILFFLFLIVLFAFPIKSNILNNSSSYYIFIDNSLSTYKKYEENQIELYKKKISELYNSLEGNGHLYLFNIEMTKNLSMPVPITSKKDITSFFHKQIIYNQPFQFSELNSYLNFHKTIFFNSETKILLFSDYQKNKFDISFKLNKFNVSLIKQNNKKSFELAETTTMPLKLFFINEKIPFKTIIRHYGDKKTIKTTITKDGKESYIKSENFKKNGSVTIKTDFSFDTPGLHLLTLIIGDEKKQIKYYYPLYISEKIKIGFFTIPNSPIPPFFNLIFADDIRNGNIQINKNNFNFVITDKTDNLTAINALSRDGGIIFLSSSKDIKKMNDNLKYNLGIQSSILEEINNEREYVKADQHYENLYSIFNTGDSIKNIYINNYYPIKMSKSSSKENIIIYLNNFFPFLMKSKNIFIFPFSPNPKNSNLFLHGSVIPLFMQIFLNNRLKQNYTTISGEMFSTLGPIIPLSTKYNQHFIAPPGVYSNAENIFTLNPKMSDYLSDSIKDLAVFFPKVDWLDLSLPMAKKKESDNNMFSYRALILLVLFLILISLLILFIAKSRFAEKITTR